MFPVVVHHLGKPICTYEFFTSLTALSPKPASSEISPFILTIKAITPAKFEEIQDMSIDVKGKDADIDIF